MSARVVGLGETDRLVEQHLSWFELNGSRHPIVIQDHQMPRLVDFPADVHNGRNDVRFHSVHMLLKHVPAAVYPKPESSSRCQGDSAPVLVKLDHFCRVVPVVNLRV